MKFNDQLHEDLFDLFVANSLWGVFSDNTDIGTYDYLLSLSPFLNHRGLFPLENHPEEYECYLSDLMLRLVKQSPKGSKIFKHKIKITVTGEE